MQSRKRFRFIFSSLVAIAGGASVALSAQSCGVFPAGTCADKATCDAATATGSEGGGLDVGSTFNDIVDVTSEQATMPDSAGADQAASDTLGPDTLERDVVSFDVGDADVRDVASEDAPPPPPVDGCAELGCPDAGCSGGSTCAALVPAGWTGPALLWSGGMGSSVPMCPPEYPNAVNANAGPTGSPDTCNCTCSGSASGQSCSVAVTMNNDANCSTSCWSGTVTSSCTDDTKTSTCLGTVSLNVPAPSPTGGSCTPNLTKTNGSMADWTTVMRVCSLTGSGGCRTAACLPPPPQPFGTTLCVYQNGSASCPAGYPNSNVFYTSQNDTRDCIPCTCTPTGGNCAGTIDIFGISTQCTATGPATYTLGSGCQSLSPPGSPPTHLQGNLTLTPGTCTLQTGASPTGSVSGTGPITVCCM